MLLAAGGVAGLALAAWIESKNMMSYTKSNLLAHAAQAMLAQANQNAGSVLGLLG